MSEGLTNGSVQRLNEHERRLGILEPMVYDLRADVREIKSSNQTIKEDIGEIKTTINDAAKGKVQTSASQWTAIIISVGAIIAAIIGAIAQFAG